MSWWKDIDWKEWIKDNDISIPKDKFPLLITEGIRTLT